MNNQEKQSCSKINNRTAKYIEKQTVNFNTIQYNAIQYNTTQYNTIQYDTIGQ